MVILPFEWKVVWESKNGSSNDIAVNNLAPFFFFGLNTSNFWYAGFLSNLYKARQIYIKYLYSFLCNLLIYSLISFNYCSAHKR